MWICAFVRISVARALLTMLVLVRHIALLVLRLFNQVVDDTFVVLQLVELVLDQVDGD